MQKSSIKKLSVLGLVLIGASAVTAAIIPSKVKDQTGRIENNSTRGSVNNLATCRPGTGGVACNVSATTNTTASGNTSADNELISTSKGAVHTTGA